MEEKKIVAIQECSAGNNEVGDMWYATAIFDLSEPIINIVNWAEEKPGSKGRLIITLADDKRISLPELG